MLSEALTEKLVEILVTEADRTARSAGLDVDLNRHGILNAWKRADSVHVRQLALNAHVDSRMKRTLLINLAQPKTQLLLLVAFLGALEERTRTHHVREQAAS